MVRRHPVERLGARHLVDEVAEREAEPDGERLAAVAAYARRRKRRVRSLGRRDVIMQMRGVLLLLLLVPTAAAFFGRRGDLRVPHDAALHHLPCLRRNMNLIPAAMLVAELWQRRKNIGQLAIPELGLDALVAENHLPRAPAEAEYAVGDRLAIRVAVARLEHDKRADNLACRVT